jgi:hypothetical protein
MTDAEGKFTLEYARECFEYRDGVLYWRERPAHHFRRAADHITFIKKSAGKVAGRQEPKGYIAVKMRLEGRPVCISAHRIIWLLHYGKWPEYTIDHINRNKRDNRIENLRDVTMGENLLNRGNPNSTGICGVSRSGEKFSASIRIGDSQVHLGTYTTTDAALDARLLAESAALEAVQKPQHARLVPLRVLDLSPE